MESAERAVAPDDFQGSYTSRRLRVTVFAVAMGDSGAGGITGEGRLSLRPLLGPLAMPH